MWLVLLAALLGAQLVASAPPARADAGTCVSTPSKDSWTEAKRLDLNHGTEPVLWVSVKSGALKNSHIGFDVACIPAGATVTATRLEVTPSTGSTNTRLKAWKSADATWGELAITWRNQPAAVAGTDSPEVAVHPVGSPVVYTIPAAGRPTANGLVAYQIVKYLGSANADVAYRSKEAGGAIPRLLVDWETGGPATTTTSSTTTSTTVGPTTTTSSTTTSTTLPPPGCQGVQVSPATPDIQGVLNTSAEGAVICFAAGEYRSMPQNGWQPRNNQQLIGAFGADLNGSKLLTSWTPEGGDWWATADLPPGPNGHGECVATKPLCTERQDVFSDDVRLSRVGSQAAVVPGTFWTDYARDRVYVGSDPAGHKIEVAWANRIISGSATGVVVRNFVIQKAANDFQSAAVEPTGSSTGQWTVEYNDVRQHHGGGIGLGKGPETPPVSHHMVLRHNLIRSMGQIGFSGQGDDHLIQNNEIRSNADPIVGVSAGWEGGAQKVVYSRRVQEVGNYVHDNFGPAVWYDIGNWDVRIDGNYVRDNADQGIHFEISCSGEALNNTLVNNGASSPVGFYTGGQAIAAESPNFHVHHNRAWGRDGIGIRQQGRSFPFVAGYGCELKARNFNSHDNEITNTGGGWHMSAGIVVDPAEFPDYQSWGITNEANAYHNGCNDGSFGWNSQGLSFSGWQGFGFDSPVGSCDGNAPSPPPPPALTVGPQP